MAVDDTTVGSTPASEATVCEPGRGLGILLRRLRLAVAADARGSPADLRAGPGARRRRVPPGGGPDARRPGRGAAGCPRAPASAGAIIGESGLLPAQYGGWDDARPRVSTCGGGSLYDGSPRA